MYLFRHILRELKKLVKVVYMYVFEKATKKDQQLYCLGAPSLLPGAITLWYTSCLMLNIRLTLVCTCSRGIRGWGGRGSEGAGGEEEGGKGIGLGGGRGWEGRDANGDCSCDNSVIFCNNRISGFFIYPGLGSTWRSGKIVFFHNSLQPLPRQHRCKRLSKLSAQCECTVTPIGW